MIGDQLPGLLGEIADIAGEEAALKIAAYAGGTSQYIPGRASDDHWLVKAVGREAADKICAHFGNFTAYGRATGQAYSIPLGPMGTRRAARRLVARELAKGTSARDAARLAGVHERTVWRVKASRDRRNDDQGELL